MSVVLISLTCIVFYIFRILSSVGLFIIAFGTGGIKPCVSAFGGDQFDADQVRKL